MKRPTRNFDEISSTVPLPSWRRAIAAADAWRQAEAAGRILTDPSEICALDFK